MKFDNSFKIEYFLVREHLQNAVRKKDVHKIICGRVTQKVPEERGVPGNKASSKKYLESSIFGVG